MLLGSLFGRREWAKSAADVCKAYSMVVTFETFHVLRTPLKELVTQNMCLDRACFATLHHCCHKLGWTASAHSWSYCVVTLTLVLTDLVLG